MKWSKISAGFLALWMGLGLSFHTVSASDAERYIDLGGTKLRVRIEGPENADPVILLHGFTASLESWDGWTDALKDDYRIIRYDLMGHGMTGPDALKRYSPAERVGVLADLMDALDIERAHIGGNSLGGLVAWRFAASHPGKVKSLLLVSPGAYSINGVTDTPVEAPAPLQMFLQYAPLAGVEVMLKGLFGDPARLDPARIESYHAMMAREGNGDAFVEHIGEFVLPDPEPDLAKIGAPSLIIWGEMDSLIPLEQGKRMTESMQKAKLEILESVGHMAQEEVPALTANLVSSFLARSCADQCK